MAQSYKNSEKMKVHLNSFLGGASIDFKLGIASSFYQSQALDFRQKASQMSVLPGFSQSSNILNDLPLAIDQDLNGIRYMVGSKGYVYRINNSDVISPVGRLSSNGAAGVVYNAQNDQLYMSGQQTVSLYGQLTNGSPIFRTDNFGKSASVAPGVIYIFNTSTLSYDGGTDSNTGLSTVRNNLNTLTATGVTSTTGVTNTLTNTYILPNTITENIGQYCAFVPDIEPFYSVAVYVTTIGTGSYTLTMHDTLNNNLGAATITHANIQLGWNEFVFSAPGIRAFVNAVASPTGSTGYHFHLISSAANDTAAVATIAPNDLTGCNFTLFAYRLAQTNNGWHPMTTFNNTLCIGNGLYVSTYNFGNDSNPNNTQWVRHRLFTDVGFEITGLTTTGQYLVATSAKTSNTGSRQYQGGYIHLWDGQNQQFNQSIPVPMGTPYSPFCQNNVVYFYCAGSLFAWGGGTMLIKVRYMAYQNTDYLGSVDHTVVNPNMMTSRYNLLMLGYPSSTTNPNVNYGVYSWGAVELSYPNSFGYSYTTSLAPTVGQNYSSANNMQIGMVKNFVDTTYMSWQYTDGSSVTHYGLDILNNSSTPAPTYSWQSLIWDGGVRYKTKRAYRLRINFLPLPAGCTLTAEYNLDRSGWISTDPGSGNSYSANTGDTAVTIELNEARFKEIQFGFFGTCSASAASPPTITGVTLELDPLESEVALRHATDG